MQKPALIDEDMLRDSLLQEQAKPHDIADALAENKAAKVARKHPEALVLGCDQVLEFNGAILNKPVNRDNAKEQLMALRGKTHTLLSAIVLYDRTEPIWRHTARAKLTMNAFSDGYLDAYLERNWPAIGQSVGAYMLESEGLRLFSHVEGDYFTILGLPMFPLLSYLSLRGFIPS